MFPWMPPLVLLLGCPALEAERDPDYRVVTAGAPVVGAAEAPMDLPVGTPLGGYTHRLLYGSKDSRDSMYATAFVESVGIQLAPMVKVIWLHNGDDHLIWVKADLPYSYDQLAWEASTALSEQLGMELDGKVVVSTSHSHHAYGPFTDQYIFYLGGDKYNEEVYQRLLGTIVDTSVEAWNTREDAAIAVGWDYDWDPDDLAYRDRRDENDDLLVWDDQEEPMGKDPWLGVWRFDSASTGDPLATIIHYGFHPYALADDNNMASADGTGGLEQWVQEHITDGVVMQVQAGAGDISIAGVDNDYAQAESIGELAGPSILALYEQLTPSTDPIELEVWTSSYRQEREDITVSRLGEVDWQYAPVTDDYEADEVVYTEDGDVISPLDEFNAEYGAAFCGDAADPLLGAESGFGATAFPYQSCMRVEEALLLIQGPFQVPEEELTLPLHETRSTQATVMRIGGLATLPHDAGPTEEDVLVGFFPGETTTLYLEQWRRMATELGYDRGIGVGYSQDHEGYLLLTEDWLRGGYEPNINVWGPLQADYIMDRMITDAEDILGTDVHEPLFPLDRYLPLPYLERDLPDDQPDQTEDAGTRITEDPDYLFVPHDIVMVLDTPAEVERVADIVQLAWYGGDPAVDRPRVTLQHEQDDGSWAAVTTASGREINEIFSDILVSYTPNPLSPFTDDQQHQWWAGWQAVGHVQDRLGVPEGTYRLHVAGLRYTGGNANWPWTNTEAYEVEGPSFEVVPATLSVTYTDGLYVSLEAPVDGYRLLSVDGSSTGANPVGSVSITFIDDDGVETSENDVSSTIIDGWSLLDVAVPDNAASIIVTDEYGNSGTLTL